MLDFLVSFFLRGLSDWVGGFSATSRSLVAWSYLVTSGLVRLGWWWVSGAGWLLVGLVLVWVVGLVGCIGSFNVEGCWFWFSFNTGGLSLIISFFDSSSTLVVVIGGFRGAGFVLGIGWGGFKMVLLGISSSGGLVIVAGCGGTNLGGLIIAWGSSLVSGGGGLVSCLVWMVNALIVGWSGLLVVVGGFGLPIVGFTGGGGGLSMVGFLNLLVGCFDSLVGVGCGLLIGGGCGLGFGLCLVVIILGVDWLVLFGCISICIKPITLCTKGFGGFICPLVWWLVTLVGWLVVCFLPSSVGLLGCNIFGLSSIITLGLLKASSICFCFFLILLLLVPLSLLLGWSLQFGSD